MALGGQGAAYDTQRTLYYPGRALGRCASIGSEIALNRIKIIGGITVIWPSDPIKEYQYP